MYPRLNSWNSLHNIYNPSRSPLSVAPLCLHRARMIKENCEKLESMVSMTNSRDIVDPRTKFNYKGKFRLNCKD